MRLALRFAQLVVLVALWSFAATDSAAVTSLGCASSLGECEDCCSTAFNECAECGGTPTSGCDYSCGGGQCVCNEPGCFGCDPPV